MRWPSNPFELIFILTLQIVISITTTQKVRFTELVLHRQTQEAQIKRVLSFGNLLFHGEGRTLFINDWPFAGYQYCNIVDKKKWQY